MTGSIMVHAKLGIGADNSGKLVVTSHDKGHAIMEVKDFIASPAMCTQILGYFNGAAKQTRARNVSVTEIKCRNKGHTHCVFEVSWDA